MNTQVPAINSVDTSSFSVGKLRVTVHRTVRVKEGRTPSSLPPSLGHASVYRVKDYSNSPKHWDQEAIFIPVHEGEALWFGFSALTRLAVVIGAGAINAISGKPLTTKLESGSYLITPPQPWIDGWKAEDGNVYQFVATEFKEGEGLTVGEQLNGGACKSGAIGIAVFEPKDPSKLTPITPPSEVSFCGKESLKGSPMTMSLSKGLSRGGDFSEMGVGKGGMIKQKIYQDPDGVKVWKEAPASAKGIYLVNAEEFKEITEIDIPTPKTHKDYAGKWYDVKDDKIPDTEGSSVFAGLKSAFVE